MNASSSSSVALWTLEVASRDALGAPAGSGRDPRGRAVEAEIRSLGWRDPPGVVVTALYFVRDPSGAVPRERIEEAARVLFSDPVTQTCAISVARDGGQGDGAQEDVAGSGGERGAALRETASHRATVLKRAGVMDPVEASAIRGLADLEIEGVEVRTAERFYFFGRELGADEREMLAAKVLSNPVIEEVCWDDEPVAPPFAVGGGSGAGRRDVRLAGLDDAALLEVSRQGQLSLNLEEMRAIESHFAGLGRDPTEAELETLAQTWSEHCCHKTFTGLIEHRRVEPGGAEKVERVDNLLRETIRRATDEVAAPWCLSVFHDNAGVIALDDELGISFKVETHNHPSAIEPYGGAGTGIGGVIRDTLGTGLGARPIVNTDVFCFGPPDLPWDRLPPGALHPLRVLRGVVSGVRDYGNRMGIPTASGALYFDERYVGNPLVFCGSVGVIPRDAIEKEVRPGDRIYVLGGRTGRDGIHGATFSSVELTEESEVVSSGAVQIGNAITEKKVLDVLLQARDRRLFRAVTDCGAGGFSSAVGEMGSDCGARVQLDRAPLKYQGLSATEIWISEAQERMVLAVPPGNADELEALARAEDVECVFIGEFTDTGRLALFHGEEQVGDLSMEFLHEGRPRTPIASVYRVPAVEPARYPAGVGPGAALHALLAAPNIASKEWVIRQYDHEVQGQSVLKPLQGPGRDGPGDAVAFTPRVDSDRAIVIACGMNPCYGDLDPYRMALSAVDEAVRNIVAAGGDPGRVALLDNFAWGNTRRPEILGGLVEAARGCRDAAIGLGAPFISGKDSLNNEFQAGGEAINIPPSLLISSISVIDDAHGLVSMDLKAAGNALILVGETLEELGGSHYFRHCGGRGGQAPGVDLPRARRLFARVFGAIRGGLIASAHDPSEGGLAVAVAEMAFAGRVGAELACADVPGARAIDRDDAVLFSESNSRLLLEVRPEHVDPVLEGFTDLPAAVVGRTIEERRLRVRGRDGSVVIDEDLDDLRRSWKRLSEWLVQ